MPIENPNSTFARLFALSQPIDVSDAPELASADSNADGRISMREARDRLIQQSKVLADPGSKKFKADLEAFLLAKTGRAVDVTDASKTGVSRVFYVQVNNLDNKALTEESDLRGIVKRDPDQPVLDRVNLTEQFNTQGDKSACMNAFLGAARTYFDGLIANGQRMTGFIISGHSNGTDMLQEANDHLYWSNLDIRTAMTELRSESDEYAALMDGCEKVGLLACFQGAALGAWGELFPNASLAGTQDFAPASTNHASAAIYDAAATAHQVIEDAGTGDAIEAGRNVPFNADLRTRGLDVQVPNALGSLARAQSEVDQAKKFYTICAAQIASVRANGRAGVQQDALDRYYRVARTYQLASEDLWKAQGRPGGVDGPQAQQLADMRFEADDLFAIRKNTERPIA